jgi:hypothetical protein
MAGQRQVMIIQGLVVRALDGEECGEGDAVFVLNILVFQKGGYVMLLQYWFLEKAQKCRDRFIARNFPGSSSSTDNEV